MVELDRSTGRASAASSDASRGRSPADSSSGGSLFVHYARAASRRAPRATFSPAKSAYIRKPHGGRLRVALAFPNTYFVGMSNLGFQTVYRLFNELRGRRVRARVPAGRSRSCRRSSRRARRFARSNPARRSATSTSSPSRCRSNGTTPTSSRCCGSPACPCARRARTTHDPLVVIGGAVTFVNPEPLALFADVIAAGEGEVLDPVADVGASARPTDRDDLLRRLAAERGFYIPSFYDVRYDADGTHRRRSSRKPGTGAPAVVKKAAVKTHRAARSAGDDASSRPTPSSARASSSRSCAAAPTCAASAGPATTTCRCAPFPRTASWSWRARPARTRQPRRPRLDRALRPPGDRAHPRRACSRWATPSARPRCASTISPTPIVRMLHAERRAVDHHRARDRLRPAAPGDQQDGDQRRDPREGRADLRERHREPEALLHDRPPDRDGRGPARDPRSDRASCATSCCGTRVRAAASAGSSRA